MFLKGSNLFSDSRTYYVVYENVDGLSLSNPVILNGVMVGSVQDIKLMPEEGNLILVELDVMENLNVGDSTIASLANSDLLGSKAIMLYLGNSDKKYNGGERLIPYRETSITDMLSSKAVPVIDKVDTTLARVNRMLENDNARNNVQKILENTEATTAAVAEILRANQQNINDITSNLNQLLVSFKSTQRHLDHLAMNMTEITDTLKQVEINRLVNNANSAVQELETAVAKLNSNEGSLGKFVNDDELYRNMASSTEALNLLLRDIQAYPKRYVEFSLIGRKDKYKVDATGRVITLDEVKDLQEQNPEEFRRTDPDTVYVPVPTDTTRIR